MQVFHPPGGAASLTRLTPIKPAVRRAAAFSLVEVTLAIGIVGFAVVSIFGTMSVGLNTIHDATSEVTNAQILAQVSSSLLQTPFNSLGDFAAQGPLYFDQAGRQLKTSDNALYRVNLTVSSGGTTTYPGAPGGLDASAKSVQINIQSALGAQSALRPYRTVLLVPKS